MKYLPKLFFILNKYIPLNNYSINYFKGGIQDSFGNNIQQIGLALVYIHKIRGNFYFKNHTYINQFSVINSRFHNLLRFFKKKYRFFYFNKKETDFYKRKNYFDDTENDFPINSNEMIEYKELIGSVLKKYVTPNLNFFKNIEIDRSTLVIHIRSGDVFLNNWENNYIQNPMAYYLTIMKDYKKIILVTSPDLSNPVIPKLLKLKNVTLHATTVTEDFNLLLNAPNLASSGVGTYSIAAALLSNKLEKFYCSTIYLDEHLNPDMIDSKKVEITKYEVSNYINFGEFRNSDESIQKIMNENFNSIKLVENNE